jgi:hypothetical protein
VHAPLPHLIQAAVLLEASNSTSAAVATLPANLEALAGGLARLTANVRCGRLGR